MKLQGTKGRWVIFVCVRAMRARADQIITIDNVVVVVEWLVNLLLPGNIYVFFFFYVCGVRKTTARAPYTCEANAKVLLWKEEKKREENNMIRMAYTSIILKMHNSCMRCVNFLLHLAFHSHVFVRLWHWNRPKSTVCVCNAISRERTNYFPYFT